MNANRTSKQIAHAEYMRKWRKTASAESLEKQKEAVAKWNAEHAEYLREWKHEYYLLNKSKWEERQATPEHKARAAKYRKTASGRATKKRAKSRERGCPVVTLTAEQWESTLVAFNRCCAYCGASSAILEQEHVVPLRKGGHHALGNVVPSCRKCNMSKGLRDLDGWIAHLQSVNTKLQGPEFKA